jgi:hypothetical protein
VTSKLLQREHHADDVLADVVDVALHGGHDDVPARRTRPRAAFSGFDVRHQVGHGLFHHARAT